MYLEKFVIWTRVKKKDKSFSYIMYNFIFLHETIVQLDHIRKLIMIYCIPWFRFTFQEASLRALQLSNGRMDIALDYLTKQTIDTCVTKATTSGYTKLIRKPSVECELFLTRGSPALDSGTGSSRSDSPWLVDIHKFQRTTSATTTEVGIEWYDCLR